MSDQFRHRLVNRLVKAREILDVGADKGRTADPLLYNFGPQRAEFGDHLANIETVRCARLMKKRNGNGSRPSIRLRRLSTRRSRSTLSERKNCGRADANSEWDARQSGLPLNRPVKLYRSGISALRSAVSSGWRRVPVLPKIDLS